MILESDYLNVPADGAYVMVLSFLMMSIFLTVSASLEDPRGSVKRVMGIFAGSIAGVSAIMLVVSAILVSTGTLAIGDDKVYVEQLMVAAHEAGIERPELVRNTGDRDGDPVLVGSRDGEYVRCELIDHAPGQIRLSGEGC